MEKTLISLPVVCPICGENSLVSYCLSDIVGAICRAQPVALRSPCHEACWVANAVERSQIQDYCLVTVFHMMTVLECSGVSQADRSVAYTSIA